VNCEHFMYLRNMRLRRDITFILTLLILFADSGQTIYSHTCNKTKHTHISIGQPNHCCADKSEGKGCSVKKSACCEVSSKLLKQDFVNTPTVSNQLIPVFVAIGFPQIFIPYPTIAIGSGSGTSPSVAFSKASKAFTQTFRI
jgi:hypothetical protein